MSQTTGRKAVAQAIIDLDIPDLNVYTYVPETPAVPCIAIADGDPVIERIMIGLNRFDMHLRLVLMVPNLDTESSWEMLQTLTDWLLVGLPLSGFRLETVAATHIQEVGDASYLSREIPLTIRIDLGDDA